MSISVDNVKYSIVSINDRAANNKKNTRKMMSNFKEVDINSIDGNIEDVSKLLNNLKISLKKWSWPDGPRGGDIGLWLSNINIFNKIIDENIDNLVVFEDDAIIGQDFKKTFYKILKEIPEDYDFISLVFPSNSKYLYKDDANIGLDTVCLAKYNHFSTIAMMWSKAGAEKMINILSKEGIVCPIDIFLYDILLKKSRLIGYSIRPDIDQVVFHGYGEYGSMIDLDGKRGMLDV